MKKYGRSQRPYVATTEQIWTLHDLMRERYEAGLLLAAFAGLRLAEVSGLRVSGVGCGLHARQDRAVADAAGSPGQSQGEGLPDGFRFHESPALLCLTADQLQAGREGGAVAVTARVSEDDVGHVPHLWPDSDDRTRAAIDNAITARSDSADFCGLVRRAEAVCPSQQAVEDYTS